MKAAAERNLLRWLHIGTSAVIGTYIYSPLSTILWFQILTKAFVIPATVITGLWMWKGHQLRKKFAKPKILGLLVFLAVVLNFQVPLKAQNSESIKSKRWGIEFSPIGAGVFRLAQGKWTYALNPNSSLKTELGLGYLIQPETTAKTNDAFNTDGLYSAYMGSVAVRQYFWKGLHFEEVVNFGKGRISNSKVDGKEYRAFLIFTQTFLGYKFNLLKREKFGLFLIGQGGIGCVPLNTNQWPRVEKDKFSIYGLGDLKMGINF
jgi:hypothetical protein